AHLRETDERVHAREAPLSAADVAGIGPDWVVSHGDRHIVRADAVEARPGRFVNLRIALLPYNRGADPNLWSWVDGTPKGVTIHLMEPGVDTGPVLAQSAVARATEGH